MKKAGTQDPRRDAQASLARMFKAGADHFYIFDRMKSLRETKQVLEASAIVAAELLLMLTELISVTARATEKTVHQAGVAKAQKLIPQLKGWKGSRSDWLGSGVERVPLGIVPLLLRKKVAWKDDSLAQALKCCRSSKSWTMLTYHRGIIQAFVAQVRRHSKSNGIGPATQAELRRLQVKLEKFAASERSRLATWAKKQAYRVERLLWRVAT